MTRIAHISDLHFGRSDPELLAPLVEALNEAQPDLVAVTGDFTQRARRGQYRDARAFLDQLDAPWLSVPGNHDVSLDNLWLRFMRPYARYRKHIASDLLTVHETDDFIAVGLNTVDRFRVQRGKVRWMQLRQACNLLTDAPGVRVVLAHHPFEQDADVAKSLMKGAEAGIEQLAECGAQVVLSGHLHRWRTEPFLSSKFGRQILQVHVGTGLSTRLRGQENDFALLDLTIHTADVTRMVARGGRFAFAGRRTFRFGDGGWRETGDQATAGTASKAGSFSSEGRETPLEKETMS
ncbi:metallophosphoesterase family protein [Salipiger aestuarii]|uniref:3',5'-cyclic AMP phosphodiesterase CpdA n=1 Tax=Salipiger aestuarii TaxID=568098 RepID=A0A327YDU5_9RHOB|nr:metallophosphoesterase [Salipiger aestuarii]EIE51357.1 metallophosphoesterase [Citreicella sp. 357]RAK18332.1 3',5'-cyclic AMP phosphodiesterase CpdA [Salipiger aestuarii]